MASGNPKVSPKIEALIEKGLFDRLPVTFSTFFYDQIHDWELLFPAEKSYYERFFGLLDGSGPSEVDRLCEVVRQAERKMGVTEAVWPKRTFTLQQVDFLNRSPHYPEWRKAVSEVFSKIDPVLDAEIARHGRPRLVVVLSPAEMPVGPDRLWTRISQHGKRVPVEVPGDGNDYVPLLLTGKPLAAQAPSIADLFAASNDPRSYTAWCVETGDRLAAMSSHAAVVRLSYQRLAQYRTRLMKEVQQVVEGGQVRGPQQLSARLKQMKIRPDEGDVGQDPILAEFARAILLSGNSARIGSCPTSPSSGRIFICFS